MKILRLTLLLIIISMGNTLSANTTDTTTLTKQNPVTDNAPIADYNNPKTYTLQEVRFHGVQFVNTDILAKSAGLITGMDITIPGKTISQAISRIWSQRYFSDVNIVADIDGDKVSLDVYLQERPRVYRWLFEGIKKGDKTTLTEELKLKRGTELSDHVLDRNVLLIKKHYWENGYRNVEVSTKIENDPVMLNAVNVTFVIDKKDKVRIGEIKFEGNKSFSDRRLRRTMKDTHQRSINIFNSAKFDEEKFEDDKDNIIEFYNAQGFRNANIISDSIYAVSENRIGILIKLEEGHTYYINDIKWVGNTKYTTEELQAILDIKKGDIYDKKTIHKRLGIGKEENPEDLSQIKSMYQNEGYLMSQVDPVEVIVGKDSINLEIKIFEGNPFTINEVGISGNLRIDDEVIRREIYTRPGELYNRAMVMQTMRQLAQMQHFDPQTLMPNIQPVSNDKVNVSWPLTEALSDKFEASGGWGANMFIFSVGVQFTNISLKNFFKKGAWRPYPHGQNQQLMLRIQSNGTFYQSYIFGFTDPWFGGKKPNSLNITGHYSMETDAASVFTKATGYFRTTGIAAGIGRRLSWPDQYFTLYNELGYTRYSLMNKNWGYKFLYTDGKSNIITFKTTFSRNSINYPIYPSSGSEFTMSLTLTPPYSLLDGNNYKEIAEYFDKPGIKDKATIEKYDRIRYNWIEYHKWKGSAQWFFPLTANNKLVLMAKAEMGYLGHYNQYKISPFEGFDLGGDGMTGFQRYGADIISLRGYPDGSLNPLRDAGDYAKVYNKYTIELRHPIIQQPQATIYGLVFAEGGNSFTKWQEFDPFTIKRSLGAGVRVYLPLIGMIGVDWGYGFDHIVGGNKPFGGKFHFMIGMQF